MPVHFASDRYAEKKGWERMGKTTKSTCLPIDTLEGDGDTGGSKAILQGKDRRTNTINQIYIIWPR